MTRRKALGHPSEHYVIAARLACSFFQACLALLPQHQKGTIGLLQGSRFTFGSHKEDLALKILNVHTHTQIRLKVRGKANSFSNAIWEQSSSDGMHQVFHHALLVQRSLAKNKIMDFVSAAVLPRLERLFT